VWYSPKPQHGNAACTRYIHLRRPNSLEMPAHCQTCRAGMGELAPLPRPEAELLAAPLNRRHSLGDKETGFMLAHSRQAEDARGAAAAAAGMLEAKARFAHTREACVREERGSEWVHSSTFTAGGRMLHAPATQLSLSCMSSSSNAASPRALSAATPPLWAPSPPSACAGRMPPGTCLMAQCRSCRL
jgi:hypothetical protein